EALSASLEVGREVRRAPGEARIRGGHILIYIPIRPRREGAGVREAGDVLHRDFRVVVIAGLPLAEAHRVAAAVGDITESDVAAADHERAVGGELVAVGGELSVAQPGVSPVP